MDITLIIFITIIALFFISAAIFKRSPLMAIAGGILFISVATIILIGGIELATGKAGNYAFNLSTTNDQITGNLTDTKLLTYTTTKDTYTDGLGLIMLLTGLSFLYKVVDENRVEPNE